MWNERIIYTQKNNQIYEEVWIFSFIENKNKKLEAIEMKCE